MGRHRRRHVGAISIAMVFISFLAAFVAAEIYARYFSYTGYYTPEIVKQRSLQYEAAVFSRHVFPREERIVTDWTGANKHYYINEKGYRGRNFDVTKKPGTIRIVFYGGSAVFDIITLDRDWPRRVETILRDSGYPQVEVINAGIPGHASFDSFGRLFAEGHLLDPDYVVLYNAWNDIKSFREEDPLLRSIRPFVDKQDPRLDYNNAIDRLLCEVSQIYVRIRHQYYASKLDAGPEGALPDGDYSNEISELGPRQFRVNAEMFVDLARNIGATPVLMTQARLVSRDNSEVQKERIVYRYQRLTHEALCNAFSLCDEIITRVAEEKEVALIDASTPLTGRDELFKDHVHLTDDGSQAVAELAAARLLDLLGERAEQVSEPSATGTR